MKKPVAITMMGAVLGVALLAVAADDWTRSPQTIRPALDTESTSAVTGPSHMDQIETDSPSSWYRTTPPCTPETDGSANENAAPDSTEPSMKVAEESETSSAACQTCDVVSGSGVFELHAAAGDVWQANLLTEDVARSRNVVQVQGFSGSLYPESNRLIDPISTEAAPHSNLSASRYPSAARDQSRAPAGRVEDFSWAQSGTPATSPVPSSASQPGLAESGTAVLPPVGTGQQPPLSSSDLPFGTSGSRFTLGQGPRSESSSLEAAPSAAPTPNPSRTTWNSGTATAITPSSYVAASGQTGEAAVANVRLEWRRGSEINVGQQTHCFLAVRNDGQCVAEQIEVSAVFPGTVRLLSATPEPVRAESQRTSESVLAWRLDRLAPGEETLLRIEMIPLSRGQIATNAEVRFTSVSSGVFTVAEPMLKVSLEGPQQVLVGEPASHVVTITNPGTGIATQLVLEAVIPEGLEHARGRRLLMELGSLNPGETRSVRLVLAAVKGGPQTVRVQARADAGLAETASNQLLVIAPDLSARIAGPGLRYLGRQAVYSLSVTNQGSVSTDNVRVMHKIPEGFRFITSDRGAQFDPSTRILNWFVGHLQQGQTAQLQLTLEAERLGEYTHFIRATSENGAVCDAQLTTVVEGTSSLVLELRDLEDPVEVGTEVGYEIEVRNDGTAPARNVHVVCELPAGLRLVRASGAVPHRAEGTRVSFQPLAHLGAGESTRFLVVVQSGQPGNYRVRASMTSDSISEPLINEELTKFYGE